MINETKCTAFSHLDRASSISHTMGTRRFLGLRKEEGRDCELYILNARVSIASYASEMVLCGKVLSWLNI